MATLTQAAAATKKFLLIGAIVLFAGVGTKIGYDVTIGIIKRVHPPAPPEPTAGFGKLPSLDFKSVETITSSQSLNFRVETFEGGIPILPDRATVFPVTKDVVSLLSLDRTKEKLRRPLGFTAEPEPLSDIIYKWIDPELQSRQIIFNIVNKQFELKYDYFGDSEILQRRADVDVKEASKIAQRFWNNMAANPGDLAPERITNLLLRISGGKLAVAQGIRDADFVRVNFVRNDLEKIPFISPYPDKSNMSILVSALGNPKKQMAEAHYVYWPIDTTKSATYPLKTSAEAFNELKSGNGLVLAKFTDEPVITIRKVFIAYIEFPVDYQPYLQPVIAFEGDNGFRAVVPAVKSGFIETKNEN